MPIGGKTFKEALNDNLLLIHTAKWQLVKPEFRVSEHSLHNDFKPTNKFISKEMLLKWYPELENFLDHFNVSHFSIELKSDDDRVTWITNVDDNAAVELWMKQFEKGGE